MATLQDVLTKVDEAIERDREEQRQQRRAERRAKKEARELLKASPIPLDAITARVEEANQAYANAQDIEAQMAGKRKVKGLISVSVSLDQAREIVITDYNMGELEINELWIKSETAHDEAEKEAKTPFPNYEKVRRGESDALEYLRQVMRLRAMLRGKTEVKEILGREIG